MSVGTKWYPLDRTTWGFTCLWNGTKRKRIIKYDWLGHVQIRSEKKNRCICWFWTTHSGLNIRMTCLKSSDGTIFLGTNLDEIWTWSITHRLFCCLCSSSREKVETKTNSLSGKEQNALENIMGQSYFILLSIFIPQKICFSGNPPLHIVRALRGKTKNGIERNFW